MAKIMLATPIARSDCTALYTTSVVNLIRFALTQRRDVQISTPVFARGALVAQSRSGLASRFLEDPSLTHLLFIDSDMGFRPEAVLRMLDFDKPLVACICPLRQLEPDKPLTFVGSLIKTDGAYAVDRGFARADYLGTGLMLIRRDCLEALRSSFPDLCLPPNHIYHAMGVEREVFQVFESVKGADGFFLGEDISFCRRWQSVGGEMWGLVDEKIAHVSVIPVEGRLVDFAVRQPS